MEPRGFIAHLYRLLPVPLQDAAFTAWGYGLKRQRYGAVFRERLAWLMESDWWSADDIHDYQDAKLRQIVAAAAEVPFYRRWFADAGVVPADIRGVADLPRLPLLPKRAVRQAPEQFVNPQIPRRKLRAALTSGTTGSPLRVLLTPQAQQFQWAVWWRHRARFGLAPGDSSVQFGARLPLGIRVDRPPFWRRSRSMNQVYLSTYHLTPEYMGAVADFLDQNPVRFFSGYPSAMYVLARFMRDHQRRLRSSPHVVTTGSDALLPTFAHTIRDAFGAPVTDQYGSVEACGNFSRCEHGRYHLDSEFGVVELLPLEGGDRSPWRRIVFTGLANEAMPLIRYDIGDLARLPASDAPCACGRASLSIEAIEGRTEDFVRTPDGRKAVGMNQVFEWAPGIEEGQIRQSSADAITVAVVPGPRFSKRDLEILERELRARLGHRIRIEYEQVTEIPRTPGGKFRAVVSTLPPDTAEEAEHRAAVIAGPHSSQSTIAPAA